jgi:hypothetical protein
MIIRPAPKRPVKLSITFFNAKIINAGNPPTHIPPVVKLPILIAIGAKPIARIIMPLIAEPYCNPITLKCPEFLDEPVVEFFIPFPSQEMDNGLMTSKELRTIPPHAILRVT